MLTRALKVLLLVLLLSPVALVAQIEAEKTEPAQDETVSRPPRHLRVWFTQAPDVDSSELELEGPQGKLELEGMHTMGVNDLMVRIVGRVPDGEYKARWKVPDKDGEMVEGEWSFTVKRGG